MARGEGRRKVGAEVDSGLEPGGWAGLVGRLSTRHIITFHYTLRDVRGQLLDTSQGGDPISFLEGGDQIVEGLEEAVLTLAVGQKAKVEVPAAKGYGPRDEDQVQSVLRSLLPVEGELKPGDQFQVGNDAFAPTVTVVSVDGDSVWLDANHPLAGVDLYFEVEVTAKRAATADEIAGAASASTGE